MRIIGIDPGLNKTGFGIIEVNNNNLSFIACGTIATKAEDNLTIRLNNLHTSLTKVIEQFKPDEAAIEETFVNNNPLSSLKLGQARGALILSLALCNLKITEYSTTAVKKTIVGVGRADKNQIATMIKILLPSAKCHGEDESDALAVAICHNNMRSFKNNLKIIS